VPARPDAARRQCRSSSWHISTCAAARQTSSASVTSPGRAGPRGQGASLTAVCRLSTAGPYLTGILRAGPGGDRLATWPADLRVIARRVPRPAGKQARPGEDADWEYGAFATSTAAGQAQWLDARHRTQAHVEDRVRQFKACGAASLPSIDHDRKLIEEGGPLPLWAGACTVTRCPRNPIRGALARERVGGGQLGAAPDVADDAALLLKRVECAADGRAAEPGTHGRGLGAPPGQRVPASRQGDQCLLLAGSRPGWAGLFAVR
jgi:hypothetical protein